MFVDIPLLFSAYLINLTARKDTKINPFLGITLNSCFIFVYLCDIDWNLHMNNSKYIRYLNFTRRYLFRSVGIWDVVYKYKGNLIITSQTIRYRRDLKLFQKFKIFFRIICFNDLEKSFYVESRFLDQGDFICAIHHAKYKLVGGSHMKLPSEILFEADCKKRWGINSYDNEPEFIKLWNLANDFSSKELNPNKSK